MIGWDDGDDYGQPADDETRILLVDDDDAVLKGTRRILEKAGHRVVSCNSGNDALELLASQAFDAMISDIQYKHHRIEAAARRPGVRFGSAGGADDRCARHQEAQQTPSSTAHSGI